MPKTISIPLNGAKKAVAIFAIIDEQDFQTVNQYRWCVAPNGKTIYAYAYCSLRKKSISMHRLIMGFPSGKEIDHIDHDGLNNSRSNLRACSHAQNTQNRRATNKRNSIYKGVFFRNHCPNGNPWYANVWVDGKNIHLGPFASEIEAAKAYDKRIRETRGDYAFTNF